LGESLLLLGSHTHTHHVNCLLCRRYLKRRLAVATAANDKGDKNWIQHVASVVDDYNGRKCKGTNIRRVDVTRKNELEVLSQRLGVENVYPIMNTKLLRGLSEATLKALRARFRAGQKVLLATDSNYETGARLAAGAGAFGKKSVEGSFSSKVYTVQEVLLKANETHYIIVYKLAHLEGVYYQNELIPATFAGSGPEAEEAARQLQDAREVKLRRLAAAKRRKRAAEYK
jgi:hypothetical protein